MTEGHEASKCEKKDSEMVTESSAAPNGPASEPANLEHINLTIRIPYTEQSHSTSISPSTLVRDLISSIPANLTPPSLNPSSPNRLIFQGQILDPNFPLSHYVITNNAVLHLIPPPPERGPPSPDLHSPPSAGNSPSPPIFHQHIHHNIYMHGFHVGANGVGFEPTRDLLSTILESLNSPPSIASHAARTAATIATTTPSSAYTSGLHFTRMFPPSSPPHPALPPAYPGSPREALFALLPHVGASLIALGGALANGENPLRAVWEAIPSFPQLTRESEFLTLLGSLLQETAAAMTALGVLAHACVIEQETQQEPPANGNSSSARARDGPQDEIIGESVMNELERALAEEFANEDTAGKEAMRSQDAGAAEEMREELDSDDESEVVNELLQDLAQRNARNANTGTASGCSSGARGASSTAAFGVSGSAPGIRAAARNASSQRSGIRLGASARMPIGSRGLSASLSMGPTLGSSGMRVQDEFSAVLSLRDAIKWRRIVAADARLLRDFCPRPLSRGYRGIDEGVPRLTPASAAKRSAQVMQEVVTSSKLESREISRAQAEKLVKEASSLQMGAMYEKEIEAAIAGRIANDPDFDPAVFPNAAKRFCGR